METDAKLVWLVTEEIVYEQKETLSIHSSEAGAVAAAEQHADKDYTKHKSLNKWTDSLSTIEVSSYELKD